MTRSRLHFLCGHNRQNWDNLRTRSLGETDLVILVRPPVSSLCLKCLPKTVSICRIITIQSSPDEEGRDKAATLTAADSSGDNGVNLYILAGHEAMQLWPWYSDLSTTTTTILLMTSKIISLSAFTLSYLPMPRMTGIQVNYWKIKNQILQRQDYTTKQPRPSLEIHHY